MLGKDSPDTANVFTKLKHGSIIIGCWDIQQLHTLVAISTCIMLEW